MPVRDRLVEQLGLPADAPLIEWCRSWTSSAGVPAGELDAAGNLIDDQLTHALIGYTTTGGRADPFGNVEACTVTLQLALPLLDRLPDVGEPFRLTIGAAVAGALGLALDDRPRFTGEVFDQQLAGNVLLVQGVGRRARLGSLVVGDTPWPAESDGNRVARVLDLADDQLGTLQHGTIDVGTVQLLARDVDAQPALALIEQVQTDSAGQLVERRNGDLTWHDAEHRRNLAAVIELTARELQRGLTWQRGRAGMVNTARVVYGVAPEGGERPVEVAIDELQASPAGVGPMTATLTTDLATAAAARERGRLIVARRSTPTWATPALVVDLVHQAGDQLPQLLALEHGQLVRVTGLPTLSPFQTGRHFVEGYTEQLTPYSWQLQLVTADAALAGSPIRWADVDPGLSWADLAADAALAGMSWLQAAKWQPDPTPRGRWLDVPADLSWADADPALTWATWPDTY